MLRRNVKNKRNFSRSETNKYADRVDREALESFCYKYVNEDLSDEEIENRINIVDKWLDWATETLCCAIDNEQDIDTVCEAIDDLSYRFNMKDMLIEIMWDDDSEHYQSYQMDADIAAKYKRTFWHNAERQLRDWVEEVHSTIDSNEDSLKEGWDDEVEDLPSFTFGDFIITPEKLIAIEERYDYLNYKALLAEAEIWNHR